MPDAQDPTLSPAAAVTSWRPLDLYEELRREPTWGTAKVPRSLLNTPELRVMLVAMPAGIAWPEHTATGRVSVQVLAGRIRFTVAGDALEAGPGDLLSVVPGTRHDVQAIEDSAFVLTITAAVAP